MGFLAFVFSPIGRLLGVAVAIAIAFGAGDIRGSRIEHEKCVAAAQAAKEAAAKQDTAAQQEVQQQDTEVTTQLKEQKEKDDATIRDLQKQLDEAQARPAPAPVIVGQPAKPAQPIATPCLYGANGAVPSRVLDDPRSRAPDKAAPKPAVVPAASGKPASKSWRERLRGIGAAPAAHK
jgi:Sec-independent protein translocase protein TatA